MIKVTFFTQLVTLKTVPYKELVIINSIKALKYPPMPNMGD